MFLREAAPSVVCGAVKGGKSEFFSENPAYWLGGNSFRYYSYACLKKLDTCKFQFNYLYLFERVIFHYIFASHCCNLILRSRSIRWINV